jgi:hypothetical protein
MPVMEGGYTWLKPDVLPDGEPFTLVSDVLLALFALFAVVDPVPLFPCCAPHPIMANDKAINAVHILKVFIRMRKYCPIPKFLNYNFLLG